MTDHARADAASSKTKRWNPTRHWPAWARVASRVLLWALGLSAAAFTAGTTLVVLALSVAYPNLPDIAGLSDYRPKLPLRVLSADGVLLQIGDRTYDLRRSDQTLTDAVDLMARFEGDLAAARAEHDRRAARQARIRRPGRPPKLTPAQERDIARLYQQAIRTVEELAQDYGIGSSTVY